MPSNIFPSFGLCMCLCMSLPGITLTSCCCCVRCVLHGVRAVLRCCRCARSTGQSTTPSGRSCWATRSRRPLQQQQGQGHTGRCSGERQEGAARGTGAVHTVDTGRKGCGKGGELLVGWCWFCRASAVRNAASRRRCSRLRHNAYGFVRQ
jgi:hypothetical protein